MAWWIMARELADDHGKPTGRYRKTAKSDEDGGGPYGLCECTGPDGEPGHATLEEADKCLEAKRRAATY
jgi:hypothetical protein